MEAPLSAASLSALLLSVPQCEDTDTELLNFIRSKNVSGEAALGTVPVPAFASYALSLKNGTHAVDPGTVQTVINLLKQLSNCGKDGEDEVLGSDIHQFEQQGQVLVASICQMVQCLFLSETGSNVEQTKRPRGKAGRQAKQSGGQPGKLLELLQHFASVFSSQFQRIQSSASHRILSAAVDVCLLGAESCLSGGTPAPSTGAAVLPVASLCFATRPSSEAPEGTEEQIMWTHHAAAQQLCDGVAAKGLVCILQAVLSEGLQQAKQHGCHQLLTAVTSKLREPLLTAGAPSKSSRASGTHSQQSTSLLLRLAASTPAVAFAVLPGDSLVQYLSEGSTALRKEALSAIQEVLECIVKPADHEPGHTAIAEQPTTAVQPARQLTFTRSSNLQHTEASMPEGVQASEAAEPLPEECLEAAAQLVLCLCQLVAATASSAKDANLRKQALSTAARSLSLLLASLPSQRGPLWPQESYKVLADCLSAAVQDSSKLVRAGAVKGLVSVCTSVQGLLTSMQGPQVCSPHPVSVGTSAGAWSCLLPGQQIVAVVLMHGCASFQANGL